MASKVIKLRVPEERLAVIDRAASFRGQSRTDFLLECGYREAVACLSERPVIPFDDEVYEALVATLEAPAAPNDCLRGLLSRSAPWD